ncbi:MAG TPA: CCA tRNA nucleotidyltransferase, partial [Planctomycetaceae bacterium]|nr:CCA tRNA nucleotidyltransferase [Planctomycetaceae bacterium]
LKRLLADPRRDELMELTRVTRLAHGADLEPVEFCRRYLERTSQERLAPPPLITGEDLIAAGLQPGPLFGRLLRAVREAQLNETIQSREEALQLVQRLQSTSGNDASSWKKP